MRRFLVVPVVLLAALLVGCGGGGGGGSSSITSPFAGHWEGYWADAANTQAGTLSLTIGTDGQMSGSIHNITYDLDGTASGSVSSSGQMDTVYAYPGAVYTASGTVAVNPAGHLVGTLQTYYDGTLCGSSIIELSR